MDNEHELKDCNVQAEILFVGSIAKDLDLIVNYSTFMRSKYDFSDPATKFFYDNLETYFLTFSQTLDETKMNVFMSQNEERLKLYKQYKGWKTLQRFMTLADENDVKNYFDTVKKYSLVREYGRNGFPVEKILSHRNFDKMSPNDIYRIIRTKADKINTVMLVKKLLSLLIKTHLKSTNILKSQISAYLSLGICITNFFLVLEKQRFSLKDSFLMRVKQENLYF